MKAKNICFAIGICLLVIAAGCTIESEKRNADYGIIIHGGAGTILKEKMTPETEAEIRTKLSEALKSGNKILANGGSSLDAVQKAINILEDSPHFNAGKGAVFANNGSNEMDASLMDGKTLNTGAIAGVKNVKNPINLARLVMDESPHVFMAREGAEEFARLHDVVFMPDDYFYTERRWQTLQNMIKKEKEKTEQSGIYNYVPEKYGTVGAAALDKEGNLAAGTSTGGMSNKKYGRIGDSPVIGAGTYANNNTCAISATGHGEYFIRNVVTYDISALMDYKGMTLDAAADYVVNDKLKKMKGAGGVIAIDKNGNVAMPFNTPGMYRGYQLDDKEAVIKFYGTD